MPEEIRQQAVLEEERPLVEFPALVKLTIIFGALFIGFMLLAIPWYFAVLAFFALVTLIAVFFDPYFGLLAFLVGSLLHPVEFFAEILGPLHLSRNLAFGVLLVWIFHIVVYRDFKIVRAKQNMLIALFGLALLLSTFEYFGYSFGIFLEFVKLLILYFLVVNLVRTRRKLLIVIWGLVILGAAACLIGIYQHILGIGVDYGEGVIRIRGTALDPNDYAMHLIILIPLIFGLLFNYRNILLKALLLFIFVLLVLNVVFTYSRAGMLALAFVLALSILGFSFQRQRRVLPIILITLALSVSLPFIPAKYWERAKSISDFSDPAIQARLDVWKTGLGMIKDHPFRGIGLGVFQYEYILRAYMSPDVKTRISLFSHNAYLQIGAETGVFGLIFFLLLIFFSWQDLAKSGKAFQRNGDLLFSGLALALRIGLFGYLVCATFLTQAFLTVFWIILPLAVVMRKFSLEGTK